MVSEKYETSAPEINAEKISKMTIKKKIIKKLYISIVSELTTSKNCGKIFKIMGKGSSFKG